MLKKCLKICVLLYTFVVMQIIFQSNNNQLKLVPTFYSFNCFYSCVLVENKYYSKLDKHKNPTQNYNIFYYQSEKQMLKYNAKWNKGRSLKSYWFCWNQLI